MWSQQSRCVVLRLPPSRVYCAARLDPRLAGDLPACTFATHPPCATPGNPVCNSPTAPHRAPPPAPPPHLHQVYYAPQADPTTGARVERIDITTDMWKNDPPGEGTVLHEPVTNVIGKPAAEMSPDTTSAVRSCGAGRARNNCAHRQCFML